MRKARNDRERDYLAAVEALYGPGDYAGRTYQYEDAMRRLVAKHPRDLDGAALYALAILATAQKGRDFRIYMRAAAVAEDVYQRDPDHPGALHYLIHCYDDPVHAPLGLRAARRYAKVAPDAPHALHMPSHIFVSMGMWDDVVASNEASWNASETRVERKKLGIEERGYHALYWLEYAYLQQGRFREARKLLDMMRQDADRSGSPYLRYHLAVMSSTYAIETGEWNSVPARLNVEDIDAPAAAAYLFAVGYGRIRANDAPRARASLAAIRTLQHGGATVHEHVAVAGNAPMEIMALQLDGLMTRNEQLLQQAARLEDAMPFEFGPPIPVKPAHELLGEWLLERGKYKAAREQFARALDRTPAKSRALLGLARASSKAGDLAGASAIWEELRHVRRKADVPWTD